MTYQVAVGFSVEKKGKKRRRFEPGTKVTTEQLDKLKADVRGLIRDEVIVELTSPVDDEEVGTI